MRMTVVVDSVLLAVLISLPAGIPAAIFGHHAAMGTSGRPWTIALRYYGVVFLLCMIVVAVFVLCMIIVGLLWDT